MINECFVDTEGDTVWTTGSISPFHNNFSAERDIHFDNVGSVNPSVEIVKHRGRCNFVMGLPFPVGGPMLCSDLGHERRVVGWGGVTIFPERREPELVVGEGVAQITEVVGLEFGAGEIVLEGVVCISGVLGAGSGAKGFIDKTFEFGRGQGRVVLTKRGR